jgi:hypothetical protein
MDGFLNILNASIGIPDDGFPANTDLSGHCYFLPSLSVDSMVVAWMR